MKLSRSPGCRSNATDLMGLAISTFVVDDGSKDDTADLARALARQCFTSITRASARLSIPDWRLREMGADIMVNIDADGQFAQRYPADRQSLKARRILFR